MAIASLVVAVVVAIVTARPRATPTYLKGAEVIIRLPGYRGVVTDSICDSRECEYRVLYWLPDGGRHSVYLSEWELRSASPERETPDGRIRHL